MGAVKKWLRALGLERKPKCDVAHKEVSPDEFVKEIDSMERITRAHYVIENPNYTGVITSETLPVDFGANLVTCINGMRAQMLESNAVKHSILIRSMGKLGGDSLRITVIKKGHEDECAN